MATRRLVGRVFLVGGLLAQVVVLLLLAVVLLVEPADLAALSDPLHVTIAVKDGVSWPVLCRAAGFLLLSDRGVTFIGREKDYHIWSLDFRSRTEAKPVEPKCQVVDQQRVAGVVLDGDTIAGHQ